MNELRILVIGGGGREHALAWKFRQSSRVVKVYCAPGNAGVASEAECLPLEVKDVKAAADLAEKLRADLTVVGPELPLVEGVADEFASRGLGVLGPTRAGAQLEGSKVFAKKFMERHGIPTAQAYGIFDSAIDAYAELCGVDWPLVVKADGLCGGKGVLVTSSPDEATAFIDRLMESGEFGDAGRRVILEEGLNGQELSFIVLTDGKDFIRLAPARDYKRALDEDEGPNTGGMGAYSSDEILSPELEKRVVESVVRPTLLGLGSDGIAYCGFLYFGLMITPDGPKVLEFNCRLGDPEAEVILLRADFDFAAACMETARGNLRAVDPKWSANPAVCVVMASEGYPQEPKTGFRISGLPPIQGRPGVVCFHAGTRLIGEDFLTSGGRVLMVTATGSTLGEARTAVYDVCSNIEFSGAHYRKDIAADRKLSAAP